MRRLLLAISICFATSAHAQTATPWTLAATPLPAARSLYAPLLSAATVVNHSAGVVTVGMAAKSVQVVVGSCSTYTLLIEGTIDGTNWVTLQSLSNSDFAANVTGFSSTFTQATRAIRTRLSAVSSCTVSTSLYAVP